jgi:hypothetical protein
LYFVTCIVTGNLTNGRKHREEIAAKRRCGIGLGCNP